MFRELHMFELKGASNFTKIYWKRFYNELFLVSMHAGIDDKNVRAGGIEEGIEEPIGK
jgi:hypothetical protein